MPNRNAAQKTRRLGLNPYITRRPLKSSVLRTRSRRKAAAVTMKPLKSESQDAETLRDLGSASVQIVHDLKNQLNGLKLYATFLRKRMEKGERPADELETISKLIAGLERAAADMTLVVRDGRALELRRQTGTDLARLLSDVTDGANFKVAEGSYEGDFAPALLAEALKNITRGGYAEGHAGEEGPTVQLRRESSGATPL